ncbi:hypothetical protein [Methanoculleus frigidifontis]|uniref:hypothetical protein n=1 Tax=Methanoculleus frigidifontis TaxID=2584085 RepID=UPI0026581F20|nr:hypothetical protein [Methanoculleus sp. FWC-SCC1]
MSQKHAIEIFPSGEDEGFLSPPADRGRPREILLRFTPEQVLAACEKPGKPEHA